jgi:hypothetical protein
MYVQGELWRVTERIGYEWSMAGYQQGNAIPLPAVTHNLKTNFGAKGDGVTDDTAALNNALNTMSRGVLLVPAGEAGVGVGAWVTAVYVLLSTLPALLASASPQNRFASSHLLHPPRPSPGHSDSCQAPTSCPP